MAFAKRSTMILYTTKPQDIYAHLVRIVLGEKDVAHENILLTDISQFPHELLEFNPYSKLPTLLDRDLVLYEPRIIMEYLDERFPHPPLLPVYPIARAESRKIMYRIERDWYPKYHAWHQEQSAAAKKDLQIALASVAPIFQKYSYFMSEEFSLIDCMMAALLWRIKDIVPRTAATKGLRAYADRLFARNSFKQSIIVTESQTVAA